MLPHWPVSPLIEPLWKSAIPLCAAPVCQQSKSASSKRNILLDHGPSEDGWKRIVQANAQLSAELHPQAKKIGRNPGRYGYGEHKGLFMSSTLSGQSFLI